MEQDRGLRPDGSRSSDPSLGDVDDETWYFETSDERWALQEAKNKALKESIRRNMNSSAEPPKKDPFGGTANPESRTGGGGLLRRNAAETEGSKLPREEAPLNRESWSTEPWALTPREGTADAEPEVANEERPVSRWDEMFSAKAGDDNIEAMRRWMEGSDAAKEEDTSGLHDELEAKLRALEAMEEPDGAAAGETPYALGTDDPESDPIDSEIERKLRALEMGYADGAHDSTAEAPGFEANVPLDLEIERKLRALEAGQHEVPVDDQPAWSAARMDVAEPLDLEIERKLRALELSDSDDGDANTPPIWAAPGIDEVAPLDQGIEERLRALDVNDADEVEDSEESWAGTAPDDDPYALEFERMLAANAFAEADEVPPVEAIAEQPGDDDASVRDYWSDSFRSDEPAAEASEPVVAPEISQPLASAADDAHAWAPEPITFDDWFRAAGSEDAAPNHAQPEVEMSPNPQWAPATDVAPEDEEPFEPEADVQADGWSPEGSDAPVEEARPAGPLAAAAAWLSGPDEPEEQVADDDPWATMQSVAGVPADANPNWPFPERVADSTPEIPAVFNAQQDDPWAVSPVDELEARLKADAAAGETPRAASSWPAQADPQASGTAWPAQADRPADADAAQAAALYGDAGVFDTLDEILNDEPADMEAPDSILAPSEHSWAAPAREVATDEPAETEARHQYLQRPVEWEEPKPAEGAVLLDPMRLVSEEALLADDDLDIADEDEDAVTLPAPSTLSDPGGMRPAPVEPSWLNDEPIPEPQDRGHGRAKTLIREIVETGMLALLVFLAVRASFQNFRVEGDSMFPTLHDGEFLIVNKLVYSKIDMEGVSQLVPVVDAQDGETKHVFHGPERGDIVVFRDPRNPNDDLIKRVIGLPGETIEIRDGRVYINDLLLDEPYITEEWQDKDHAKILLPENEYYVMGDNRNNSLDSRYPTIGLVREELIIGKALVSYWPRSQFGLAANAKPKCHGSPDCSPIEGEDENKIAADVAD